jgi:hypothetical protein
MIVFLGFTLEGLGVAGSVLRPKGIRLSHCGPTISALQAMIADPRPQPSPRLDEIHIVRQ